MGKSRVTWQALVAVVAVVAAGCGGDDEATDDPVEVESDGDAGAAPVEEPGTEPDAESAGDADDGGDAPDATGGDFEVAVAKYTASGPGAANTISPSCGFGNEPKGGDLLRFTPPDGYAWSGTSGGSGRDEITVRGPEGDTLTLIEAATQDEMSLVDGWEVIGPTGAEVEINGEVFPVMEVMAEGSTSYALVDLGYLAPLPVLSDGGVSATAIVTSREEGRPTLDEAVSILETVRVERCGALAQALVWSAAGGFAPVPSFEPDPLGKTRPDEPQPAARGIPTLDVYSIDQLAYLMPVDEARSKCAAEAAVEAWGENPVGVFSALRPTGTAWDEFNTVIAAC